MPKTKKSKEKVVEVGRQCPGRKYPPAKKKCEEKSIYDFDDDEEYEDELPKPDKFEWIKKKAPKKLASMDDIVAKARKRKRLENEKKTSPKPSTSAPKTGKSQISKSVRFQTPSENCRPQGQSQEK